MDRVLLYDDIKVDQSDTDYVEEKKIYHILERMRAIMGQAGILFAAGDPLKVVVNQGDPLKIDVNPGKAFDVDGEMIYVPLTPETEEPARPVRTAIDIEGSTGTVKYINLKYAEIIDTNRVTVHGGVTKQVRARWSYEILVEDAEPVPGDKKIYLAKVIKGQSDLIIEDHRAYFCLFLIDGLVIASKIADAAVTTPKVANANITQEKLADDSVGTGQIIDSNVTQPKMAPDSVGTSQIKDGNVTTEKIADGNVTTEKIGDSKVTTPKIADGNVTTPKIADGHVTNPKIADGNITINKMANNSVGVNQLIDGNVTQQKLAYNSVGYYQLINGNVTQSKLASNSVGADQLINGNVITDKIANNNVTFQKIDPSAISQIKYDARIQTSDLVIEPRSNDPSSPTTGRIWLRVDI